uniref:Uncharacterized protein n=1 Tax=Zea mays TaxID=4577 RepID=C4IZS2_MAIZE|nr:unknown [Zea mays]
MATTTAPSGRRVGGCIVPRLAVRGLVAVGVSGAGMSGGLEGEEGGGIFQGRHSRQVQ